MRNFSSCFQQISSWFYAITGRMFVVSGDNEAKIISWGIIDTSDLNLGVGEGFKVK